MCDELNRIKREKNSQIQNSRFVILSDELVKICIYSKFAAAEQDDLWHYLTEQAHRDKTLPEDLTVKIIMDTWTLQMGFPGTCLKYIPILIFDLLSYKGVPSIWQQL